MYFYSFRFDGYGDDSSNDFLLSWNSDQVHSIGWCSKNQKSLLPPASIRHTQKHWRSFLLNALQGAKTIPQSVFYADSGPWAVDRIKPGMRLEVQHTHMPTSAWVAKVGFHLAPFPDHTAVITLSVIILVVSELCVQVVQNVGGRLKLRYEGSIDDESDFWLFYQDHRLHVCGWASEHGVIYRPPDGI